MNRIITSRATVIDTLPYGEADIIATLLAEETGRIRAIAKGARRSSRRFTGSLEITDSGTFELKPPARPEQLWVIESITGRVPWINLRSNLRKFEVASFCLELANKFALEGEPRSKQIFPPLIDVLNRLDAAPNRRVCNVLGVYFCLNLLVDEGLNPLLSDIPWNEEIFGWWERMLVERAPLDIDSAERARDGLKILVRYTEDAIGGNLKTAESILS